jgi:hypothetical protein
MQTLYERLLSFQRNGKIERAAFSDEGGQVRCVEAVMLDVEWRKETEAGFAFVKTGMIMLEQGYRRM